MNKFLQKSSLLLFGLMIMSQLLMAQVHKISGKVTDDNGKPIRGVTIKIKGSKIGTTTNSDGTYNISVNDNNVVLVFSSVGYNSTEKKANSENISVSLEEDKNSLEEVQVTGALGIKKSTKNLGYSIGQIKGDDLTRTNNINPITALQGKVAGAMINVVSSNGVQTSPYIQLRGAKTIGGNNQPIFVIDGNILNNNITGGDDADAGSVLKNLNPDDYESIEVLKGAAATSLYGTRGLNGAIVIITKRGKAGKGLGIDFTSTYQTTQVYRSFMDLQNEYGMGSSTIREGNFRPDNTQNLTYGSWGPKYDGRQTPAVYNQNKLVSYSAIPDNWKSFFRNGNYINNNLAIGGATDTYNYRISYSNTQNNGTLPNNGLSRNAIDIKASSKLNKVFSAEIGVNYANTISRNFFNQSRYSTYGNSAVAFSTYYLPRNINFNDWNRTYRNLENNEIYPSYRSFNLSHFNNITNTFSRIDKNNSTRSENSLLAFSSIKAQINDWIDLTAKGNINFQKVFSETKNYGNDLYNKGGEYGVAGSYSTDYNFLFTAHAGKKINQDLTFDVRLLNEIYGNRLGEEYSARTDGGLRIANNFFLENSVNALQNLLTYKINYPNNFVIGVAGIGSINYKNYLNLEISGRNDWVSALTYPSSVPGSNNYSVFYPTANLSYIFSDHYKKFMPSWLSFGKVRASIGYTGGAGVLNPYDTGSGFSPNTTFDINGKTVSTATQFNGNLKPNLDIKPQRAREIELGTNLSFLNNRIDLDLAVYQSNTFNQVLSLPIIPETGYTKTTFNAGNIQNKGIEITLKGIAIQKKDWNLELGINLASNRSKIVKFGRGIKQWQITDDYEGGQVWSYEGGEYGVLEFRSNTTYKIDSKTGLPIIRTAPNLTNTNPDLKYDIKNYSWVRNTDADLPNGRYRVGNIQPSLMGGFTASLRYKNLSLFTQIDGRLGGWVYSQTYTYAMGNGSPKNSLQFRDQKNGGVARVDSYTGATIYDGVIPNAVFDEGQMSNIPGKENISIANMTFREAYQQGLVEPWKASVYYGNSYGWQNGLNVNNAASELSWLMLREITLGYRIPSKWSDKIKIGSANLLFTARNIGYLYNSLVGGQNPESIVSNNPFQPWITGGVPFARNYSITLNVKF